MMKLFLVHPSSVFPRGPRDLSGRASLPTPELGIRRKVGEDAGAPVPGQGMLGTKCAALTLLEMMVSVTLLAVIMVSLLLMFNQTQKALHIVSQQSDVFEATRAVVQMIGRDLAEVSDYNQPNVINFYALAVPSPVPGGKLPLPTNSPPVDFGEAFWLTRANDEWTGVGYFVDGGTNSGIGTLHRFSRTVRARGVPGLTNEFYVFTNSRPVMDGVVHFSMSAVYVTNRSGVFNWPDPTFERAASFGFPFSYPEDVIVTNNFGSGSTNKTTVNTRIALPAFIDLEFGVLEPAALKQYQSIAAATLGTTAAQNFLLNHVGQVHFFRERVPVRNFVNPYRSNEAP